MSPNRHRAQWSSLTVTNKIAKFKLQNKYQDSGWEDLGGKFYQQDLATRYAQNISENTISYGMVRVVEIDTSKIIATFTGGIEV